MSYRHWTSSFTRFICQTLGLVNGKRTRKLSVSINLLLKRRNVGLGGCYGIGSCEETKRWFLLVRDLE